VFKDLVIYMVFWRETDLPKFPPDYASILAQRLDLGFTPTATTSPIAAATPLDHSEIMSATSTTTSDQANRSRLSTGAKAGIGVGVSIAAVLLMGTAFILYRWNRRGKTSKMTRQAAAQNAQPELVQTGRP
jgi:hypothetical protein